jgi:hypothetical protein
MTVSTLLPLAESKQSGVNTVLSAPLYKNVYPGKTQFKFHNNNHHHYSTHKKQSKKQPRTKESIDIKQKKLSSSRLIKQLHTHARFGQTIEAKLVLTKLEELYLENGLVAPDSRHYNSLINAWSKSDLPGKELRAEEILMWMLDTESTKPCFAQVSKDDKFPTRPFHVTPTKISFNSCIKMWSKSSQENAGTRAHDIFLAFINLYERKRHKSLAPDFQTYRSVIHALSRNVQRGYGEKAEKILAQMSDSDDHYVTPDSTLYNVVLHIYSHNRDLNSPARVERLLNTMHTRYLQTGKLSLAPTTVSFNTCLNTYAKSIRQESADRAETILQRMQELHDAGYPNVQPDTISFNCVLNAHANSHQEGAPQRAFAIFNRMIELYTQGRIVAKPNIRTINACLKTCARACYNASDEGQNRNTLDVACSLLKYAYLQADEFTYVWFLKACQAVCGDLKYRNDLIQWSCQLCHTQGLMNKRIVEQVCAIVDKHQLSYLKIDDSDETYLSEAGKEKVDFCRQSPVSVLEDNNVPPHSLTVFERLRDLEQPAIRVCPKSPVSVLEDDAKWKDVNVPPCGKRLSYFE